MKPIFIYPLRHVSHLFEHVLTSLWAWICLLSAYDHISLKMCSHLFGHKFTFLRSGAVATTRLREEPMIVIRPPGGIVFKDFNFIFVNFGNQKRSYKLHCNFVQRKQPTNTKGYIFHHCPAPPRFHPSWMVVSALGALFLFFRKPC